MKQIILLVFVIFSINPSISVGQNNNIRELTSIPLITTYLPSEYNGGIQNWSINQDSTGYIYVANNYGLLEFDGASWNNFSIAGGTKTRSVLIDKQLNIIYVGGQRQLGVFQRTSSGLEYKDLLSRMRGGNEINEVWDLVQHEDKIYANAGEAILEVRLDTIISYVNIKGFEFLANVGGQLVAGATGRIYFLDPDKDVPETVSLGTNVSFRGAIILNERLYFFSYEDGIYTYKNRKLSRIKTTLDGFLTSSKINQVLKLSNGNIVIGTQNNGLIILNSRFEPVLHLTKNKGLNHRTVVSLYEDNFKNLWVGLNNGISVIELNSPFSLINENVGLEGTGYSALAYNNSVYLGTSSGLFKPKPEDKFTDETRYEIVEGSEGLVRNISIVDDELILSHHEGAFKLNGNRFNQFFDNTGTWGFKNTHNSNLIGGTYNGFYLFGKSSELQEGLFLDGFDESSRVFEFSNDSTLWMTHGYKGAYKITLKKDSIADVRHYGVDAGFPSDILISVYKVDNELLFTGETGIYKYNSAMDVFEPHPFLNQWFENRHVSKIRSIGNDRIYFIADGQSGVLKQTAIGVYDLEEKPFKKINRFISDDLENINYADNHNILIGAKEGFILYQPHLEQPLKEDFQTFLKKVKITNEDNEEYEINSSFFSDLEFSKIKSIHFEFSAPYYDGLEDIRYSYRLHPYEEEWSEWSGTNWKEYTSLPAGKYVFEVKALNVYENESEISSYSFTINPKWYESNLAIAIYIFVTLITFFTVLFSREKKHRTDKYIIHQSKDEEIRSKEREISEFSQKTNQQIEELKNENLKKEIDHKNSQLASVTMHLLSKNEFVMSIRKKLNDALSAKDNQDNLIKIVKSIDRNIDEDEAWDTFQFHFDQVHGNFLHKLKKEIHLTPQETKLCAYLKMNMSTKDIANLMNITVRGVELARYRLRKKLGISRDVNLTAYLDNYN